MKFAFPATATRTFRNPPARAAHVRCVELATIRLASGSLTWHNTSSVEKVRLAAANWLIQYPGSLLRPVSVAAAKLHRLGLAIHVTTRTPSKSERYPVWPTIHMRPIANPSP